MVYITYNTSYNAIQAKHPTLTQSRSQTIPFFSHPYLFIPHTPNIPCISMNEKSGMKMKWMLKIKNFLFRSQTNGIYGLYYILRWKSSHISTFNSKYNQRYGHLAISISLYFYELIGQYLIYAYNKQTQHYFTDQHTHSITLQISIDTALLR